MAAPSVVLDTNVLVAGLRSQRGASFLVLSNLGRGLFDVAISVPLLLEYEEQLQAHATATRLSASDIDTVLDYVCRVGKQQSIFYLWRPTLPDPEDDLVLELAVAARCIAIVTHNVRDFKGSERFGVAIWTPFQLLQNVGVLK